LRAIMAKNNAYAVFYKGETQIFTEWKKVDKFLKTNKGYKEHHGFTTMDQAEEWCRGRLQKSKLEAKEEIDFEPELPLTTPNSNIDISEMSRLFKLIANEYRNFTRDGDEMNIKKICLCFDKLSEITSK